MADWLEQVLQTPIQLAEQVAVAADYAHPSYRADCAELKARTQRLEQLLRQAARVDLYERPARRIMDNTRQVLEKAHALVAKCRDAHGLVKRVFTVVPASAFKKMSSQLENSDGDVSWLLRVSAPRRNGEDAYLGFPPIASNEPILALIWDQVAKLHHGWSQDDRAEAAASLVTLARDSDRNAKLVVEEGAVGPLLRLVKEGHAKGQENAARAIALLGRDPGSAEQMLRGGVCSVFAEVLKEGPVKVQAVVAWAVSELAACYPKCRDLFAESNVVRFLVGHLAFETVREPSKYVVPTKGTRLSINSVVPATGDAGVSKSTENHRVGGGANSPNRRPHGGHAVANGIEMHAVLKTTMAKSHASVNNGKHRNNPRKQPAAAMSKEREREDPATQVAMKAMAARALWRLAEDSLPACKCITDSKALLCFAALLEKGPKDVRYNCAMALLEIARAAERDVDLRRGAFKASSPAAKAAVDRMASIVEKGEAKDLLEPCVVAVGCLSRTFRATETRVVGSLVRLLDEREGRVAREAVIALTKFACDENFLHRDHCAAIVAAGGPSSLMHLVYLGEPVILRVEAALLLSYVARHVPEHEALAAADVLGTLGHASKQPYMPQRPEIQGLLAGAMNRLKLKKL